MNESHIITAVCAGDIDQYAELVERYRIGLTIYCERLVGGRSDAEDITQKAFIKAYEKLVTFEPEKGHFSTWLYKIAYNQAIDFLRQSKRRAMIQGMEEIAQTVPDVLQKELAQEVRQAVLALMPPEHRQAIEAYYWEGKSYQEIASEMRVPINTVKSWLRRAKIQLKGMLA